jgi:hypothetical protein
MVARGALSCRRKWGELFKAKKVRVKIAGWQGRFTKGKSP